MEQRFWLAFLYAATYHAPVSFYIYNEFPDAENVDIGRMQRWWTANRPNIQFQTDRRWIRSRNQFVPMVASYLGIIGKGQENHFWKYDTGDPVATYNNVYEDMLRVKHFGRFAMFLYLESVAVLTGFPIEPRGMDLKNSLSSRNGLCYAIGRDDLLCGHSYGRSDIAATDYNFLRKELKSIVGELREEDEHCTDIWSVETSLCAYKKVHRGKRYLGYYIDRQHDEIEFMQQHITNGVDWQPLWDFRRTHFQPEWLRELRTIRVVGDPRRTRPNDPSHWYRRPARYR